MTWNLLEEMHMLILNVHCLRLLLHRKVFQLKWRLLEIQTKMLGWLARVDPCVQITRNERGEVDFVQENVLCTCTMKVSLVWCSFLLIKVRNIEILKINLDKFVRGKTCWLFGKLIISTIRWTSKTRERNLYFCNFRHILVLFSRWDKHIYCIKYQTEFNVERQECLSAFCYRTHIYYIGMLC